MKRISLMFAGLVGLAGVITPAIAADAQVLLIGTFHFDNPGLDIHNVEAIDVLAEQPQAQIDAMVTAFARFRPTRVFVEWPAALTDTRYASYRDGTLAPTANEVVQLGFRLAKSAGLERVHGIDVSGAFPFEAITNWAAANGQADRLKASHAQVATSVARVGALQREEGIASALRFMNSERTLEESQALHMDLLRYGSGDDQPGAALNAAWFERNIHICARLLQQIGDNDRAVVFFGAGHIPWLRRCLDDTPGVELVDTLDYLPTD